MIVLKGMHFYAFHGFYEEERKTGNNFTIDLYVTINLSQAGRDDNLENTINYEQLYNVVERIMQEKYKLLEHIAHKILTDIEINFKAANAARIKVSKLNPPIKGDVEKVTVEMERTFKRN